MGTLEIHGKVQAPTWTQIDQTVDVGDTSMTLQVAVEWQPGEKIVIASTDFSPYHAEELEIVDVSDDGKTIEFTPPLNYMHFGQETYGSPQFAEVALLSRRMKIRGMPRDDGFGGHQYYRGAPLGIHLSG